MSTSGAVAVSTFGSTVYSYPVSGTFAADRAAVIGNTSAAAAQVGANFGGILTPPTPRNYRTTPVLLDGTDYSRTTYGAKTVVVPVVIYETTAYAALVEWRRILAAFEPRYFRAAIEVTDPNSSGQAARWLTELILDDFTDIPLEHDSQNYYIARLIFQTNGQPFWTPEPVSGNYVSGSVSPTDGSVYQLNLTNPGSEGAWPIVHPAGFTADVSFTLAETGEQVDLSDSNNVDFDFDRRQRDPDDDSKVTAASVYFQIPPGDSRIDIVVFNGSPGGSATVTVKFLPRYLTC